MWHHLFLHQPFREALSYLINGDQVERNVLDKILALH